MNRKSFIKSVLMLFFSPKIISEVGKKDELVTEINIINRGEIDCTKEWDHIGNYIFGTVYYDEQNL